MILLTQLFQFSELFSLSYKSIKLFGPSRFHNIHNSRINKHLRLRKFRNFILIISMTNLQLQLFKTNIDKEK